MDTLRKIFKPMLLRAADGTGGGDGGTATSWVDTLPEETRNAIPEEFRKDPNVTKYKDVGEFFKGHRSLVETIGKKGIILPGKDAKPEEWHPIYEALGRPKKSDEYKLTMPENLHPSIKPTPESQKAFFDTAHKLGLSNSQANELNGWYMSLLSKSLGDQDAHAAAETKAATEALKKEWGDKYDDNLKAASNFVERVAGPDGIADFGDLGNKPGVLKTLHKLSAAIGEDTIAKIIGGKGGDSSGSEGEKALKEIEEIRANKSHAYHNESDAKHDEAVQHMKKLYGIAYPEKVA